MSKVKEEKGTWTFLVPIKNLILTDAVNFEFKVNRVTFVSTNKLSRRRKKFGIPESISDLRKKKIWLNRFFSESDCFATLRQTGKFKDIEQLVLEIIREELSILSSSELVYAKRRNVAQLSISNEKARGSTSYYATNITTGSSTQSNKVLGSVSSLPLDFGWKDFNKRNGFFFNLLKILRGEIKVDEEWRKDLRNAAILAGLSQTSLDLPQAFLNNMIALELLLTKQGDEVGEALPTRAEAFLGWVDDWTDENFVDRIRNVYSKRNSLVHQGKRELIERKDLFFTDDLLFNLLSNIVRHYRIFSNKKSIIEFSKKVEAEHLLGIKSITRSKSLRYIRRSYSDRDFED